VKEVFNFGKRRKAWSRSGGNKKGGHQGGANKSRQTVKYEQLPAVDTDCLKYDGELAERRGAMYQGPGPQARGRRGGQLNVAAKFTK
jgi:hypothetical protein